MAKSIAGIKTVTSPTRGDALAPAKKGFKKGASAYAIKTNVKGGTSKKA